MYALIFCYAHYGFTYREHWEIKQIEIDQTVKHQLWVDVHRVMLKLTRLEVLFLGLAHLKMRAARHALAMRGLSNLQVVFLQ